MRDKTNNQIILLTKIGDLLVHTDYVGIQLAAFKQIKLSSGVKNGQLR